MAPSTRAADRSATTEGSPNAPASGEAAETADDPQIENDNGESATLMRGARATHTPDTEMNMDDALRRRYTEMKRRLANKRMQDELEAMEAELEGREPTQYVEVAGTTLPTRKRRHSQGTEETNLSKYIKLAPPPRFDGKSLEGLRKYELGWNKIFKTMPIIADDAYAPRILLAATFLEDRAEEAWDRPHPPCNTWTEYITLLKGVVADPVTRKSEALIRLAAVKQSSDQSVRELLRRIETIETDIPPMSEDVRKAWIYLNALSPNIRALVMHEHKEITSREQVLASAQRHEDVIKQETRAQKERARGTQPPAAPPPPSPPKKNSQQHRPRGAFKPRDETTTQEEKTPKEPAEAQKPRTFGACYNCGKKGYIAKFCRSPKRSQGSQPSQSKDESKN